MENNMNTQDRYTKIIESLVNGEEATASELLHEAFVDKAREIWTDLVEQDEMAEEEIAEDDFIGGEESDDFLDDITTNEDEIDAEEAFGEADDEEEEGFLDPEGELADDEGDAEFDFDGDGETDEHEEEHSEIEDKLVSVEDALDDLKAEFAKIMGEEEVDGEEEFGGEEEFDGEEEVGGEEEFGPEEEVDELDEAIEFFKAYKASMANGEDSSNVKSPVGPGDAGLGKGNPVNFAGGNEKGSKTPTSTTMNVNDPSDGAKLSPVSVKKNK
jgi:hypothetical protein